MGRFDRVPLLRQLTRIWRPLRGFVLDPPFAPERITGGGKGTGEEGNRREAVEVAMQRRKVILLGAGGFLVGGYVWNRRSMNE